MLDAETIFPKLQTIPNTYRPGLRAHIAGFFLMFNFGNYRRADLMRDLAIRHNYPNYYQQNFIRVKIRLPEVAQPNRDPVFVVFNKSEGPALSPNMEMIQITRQQSYVDAFARYLVNRQKIALTRMVCGTVEVAATLMILGGLTFFGMLFAGMLASIPFAGVYVLGLLSTFGIISGVTIVVGIEPNDARYLRTEEALLRTGEENAPQAEGRTRPRSFSDPQHDRGEMKRPLLKAEERAQRGGDVLALAYREVREASEAKSAQDKNEAIGQEERSDGEEKAVEHQGHSHASVDVQSGENAGARIGRARTYSY